MDSHTIIGRPYPAGGFSVAVGAGGTNTGPLGQGVKCVRIMSTIDCWIEIQQSAVTPVAGTAMYLPAYSPEYFICPDNGVVSTLQVAAAGTLYVTPVV